MPGRAEFARKFAFYYLIGLLAWWLPVSLASGVARWWAPAVLVSVLSAGWFVTARRLRQRGVWRMSPLFTAVPVAFAMWAVRGALEQLAGSTMVIVLVLLGIRELIEIGIAAAVIGSFAGSGAPLLNWYAVPVLAGTCLGATTVLALESALQATARDAARRGRVRLARVMALLSVPLSLLQPGAERSEVVSFVGVTYSMTGEPARAVWWDRWAARICRRRKGIVEYIAVLHNLAQNLHRAGRHAEALSAIAQGEQAIARLRQTIARVERIARHGTRDLRTRIFGSGGSKLALVTWRAEYELVQLGAIAGSARRDLGDVGGALADIDAALARLEGDSGLIARCRSLLSTAVTRDGSTPEELALIRTFSKRVSETYADCLSFRASVVGMVLHDNEQALELIDRALDIAVDTRDTMRECVFSRNRATFLFSLRRYSESLEWLHRILRLTDVAQFEDKDWTSSPAHHRVMALSGIANAHRVQGRTDEAEEWYREALVLASAPGAPVSVGLGARLGMSWVKLGQAQVAEARRYVLDAVADAERLGAEGFLRFAYLSAGRAHEQHDPDTAHEYYRKAIEQIENSRSSLADEAERLQFLGGEPRVEAYERMVATCVTLGRPAEAFDWSERAKARALAERLGAAAEGGAKPLSYTESQTLLDQSTLFVQYFTTADRVVILGVRSDWAEPRAVSVAIERDSLRRFVLTNFGSAGRVRDLVHSGLEELWHGYDSIIAPIATWARRDELVVLAPHGLLHYLPLHALRLDGRYLIERNPVAYTSSASVLRACRATVRPDSLRRVAVFGDPGRNLPHARTESQSVAEFFTTEPLLGEAVTRRAFTAALIDADVVHYAGHATFDADDPMASGLRLADGLLTARDVAALSGLRLWLATLSGCETGVSRHHPGDDLMGLVRGFLYAGAPSVVAGLWRVADDSTAEIMTRFYTYLPTSTKAEALRRAVVEVAEHTDRWNSLHRWAPFILIGDWE
ncbi:CHAT domain-containing protein [Nocardia vaccinii]|uniref:CHAT domain-containing protein n=1 Tax=Nocardia vaccinii TaxID=1822 RepID=UPI000A630CB6|nr:CHAT domain-containing protein [Nocardia vaccinii]